MAEYNKKLYLSGILVVLIALFFANSVFSEEFNISTDKMAYVVNETVYISVAGTPNSLFNLTINYPNKTSTALSDVTNDNGEYSHNLVLPDIGNYSAVLESTNSSQEIMFFAFSSGSGQGIPIPQPDLSEASPKSDSELLLNTTETNITENVIDTPITENVSDIANRTEQTLPDINETIQDLNGTDTEQNETIQEGNMTAGETTTTSTTTVTTTIGTLPTNLQTTVTTSEITSTSNVQTTVTTSEQPTTISIVTTTKTTSQEIFTSTVETTQHPSTTSEVTTTQGVLSSTVQTTIYQSTTSSVVTTSILLTTTTTTSENQPVLGISISSEKIIRGDLLKITASIQYVNGSLVSWNVPDGIELLNGSSAYSCALADNKTCESSISLITSFITKIGKNTLELLIGNITQTKEIEVYANTTTELSANDQAYANETFLISSQSRMDDGTPVEGIIAFFVNDTEVGEAQSKDGFASINTSINEEGNYSVKAVTQSSGYILSSFSERMIEIVSLPANETSAREFLVNRSEFVQGEVVIGQDVEWNFTVNVTNTWNETVSGMIDIGIPSDATYALSSFGELNGSSLTLKLNPLEEKAAIIKFNTTPVSVDIINETMIDLSSLIPSDSSDIYVFQNNRMKYYFPDYTYVRTLNVEVPGVERKIQVHHNSSLHYSNITVRLTGFDENATFYKEVNDTKVSAENETEFANDTLTWVIPRLSEVNGTVVSNETIQRVQGNARLGEEVPWTVSVGEYKVDYKTPAPQKAEEVYSDGGHLYRRITVYSNATDHYTNVSAYTDAGFDGKLYRIVNETRVDVTGDPEYNVSVGERLKWNVPQLSEDVYAVEITILNVQSYPMVGGYWDVAFNASGVADLFITTENGTTFGEAAIDNESTWNDLGFVSVAPYGGIYYYIVEIPEGENITESVIDENATTAALVNGSEYLNATNTPDEALDGIETTSTTTVATTSTMIGQTSSSIYTSGFGLPSKDSIPVKAEFGLLFVVMLIFLFSGFFSSESPITWFFVGFPWSIAKIPSGLAMLANNSSLETESIEYKSSPSDIQRVVEVACGFANKSGGVIILGKSSGLSVGKNTIERITNAISGNIEPFLTVRVEAEDGKIVITAPEGSNKPYTAYGRAFIRIGNTTQRIKQSEYERLLLKKHKDKLRFDNQVCEAASIEDIDESKVRWFLKTAKAERGLAIPVNASLIDALTQLDLVQGGKLTNAAILLFGKRPQKFFLQSEVKCVAFHETEVSKPFKGFHFYSDNLFEQVDKATDFVMDHLRRPLFIKPESIQTERPYEIPRFVIREAIVNAVAHRDYYSTSGAQVMVFPDRIELWSPGLMPDELTLDDLRKVHKSVPRNQSIFDKLYQTKYVERIGSGTLEMIKQCKQKGLPEPTFEQKQGGMVLTIWRDIFTDDCLQELGLNDRQIKAVRHVKEHRNIDRTTYADINNVGSTLAYEELNNLLSKGVFERYGKGPATYYVLRTKRTINERLTGSYLEDIFTSEYLQKLGLNDRQLYAIEHVKKHEKITSKDYRKQFNITRETVHQDLSDLVNKNIFVMAGKGPATYYAFKRLTVSDENLTISEHTDIFTGGYLQELGLNDRQIETIKYLVKHEKITRPEYEKIFNVSSRTANRELSKLISLRVIDKKGADAAIYYILAGNGVQSSRSFINSKKSFSTLWPLKILTLPARLIGPLAFSLGKERLGGKEVSSWTAEDVADLLEKHNRKESQTLEFKPHARKDDIGETLCSFSFTNSGIILIGVDNSGRVIGADEKDEIRAANKSHDHKPSIYPEISRVYVDGKLVLVVEVEKLENTIPSWKNVTYRRVGEHDKPLSPEEVLRYARGMRMLEFDSQICHEASLADIDENKVRWFLRTAKEERRLNLSEDTPLKDALIHLKFLKNDKLTNAAVLLFGKYPERFFIQSEVKCVALPTTEFVKPYDSYQVFEGNLFEQVDKATAFVLENIRRPLWIEPGKIQAANPYEIPEKAIREAIVNAIVHRNYYSPSKTVVRVHPDRVEIWNPGQLPPELSFDDLKKSHESIPFNPQIFKQFFRVKYVEDIGGGTVDIVGLCKAAGLPEPEYLETKASFIALIWRSFLVEKRLAGLKLNNRQRQAIGYVREYERITNKEYKNEFKVGRTTALRDLTDLVEKNIFEIHGKGAGIYYGLKSHGAISGDNGAISGDNGAISGDNVKSFTKSKKSFSTLWPLKILTLPARLIGRLFSRVNSGRDASESKYTQIVGKYLNDKSERNNYDRETRRHVHSRDNSLEWKGSKGIKDQARISNNIRRIRSLPEADSPKSGEKADERRRDEKAKKGVLKTKLILGSVFFSLVLISALGMNAFSGSGYALFVIPLVMAGLFAKAPGILKAKQASNPKAVKLALEELKKKGRIDVYLDTNILWGYFEDKYNELRNKTRKGHGKITEFLLGNIELFNFFVSSWVKAEAGRHLRGWGATKEEANKIWYEFLRDLKPEYIEEITFRNEVVDIVFNSEVPFKKRVNNILHLHIAKIDNLFMLTGDNEIVEKGIQFYDKVMSYHDLRETTEKYLNDKTESTIDRNGRQIRKNDGGSHSSNAQRKEDKGPSSQARILHNPRRVREETRENAQENNPQAGEAKKGILKAKLILGAMLLSLVLISTLGSALTQGQTAAIDGKTYQTIIIDGKAYALMAPEDVAGKSYTIKGVYYPGFNSSEINTERSLVKTPGRHTLLFTFGGESAYAYNLASDNISFVPPSPANNSVVSTNWTYINISSAEDLNQSFLEWGWRNATGCQNFTMSNASLGNWYFNVSSISDNTYNYSVFAENQTGDWVQTGRYFVSVDTAYPTIDLVSPTLANNSFTPNNWVYVNTTTSDANNLTSFINWNNSLVVWWRFDDADGTNVTDYSGYGNNGAAAGFACTTLNCNYSSGWTSGGKFGAGMVFDGVDDYIIISGG
ncbi:MAG: hypothetical protein COY38_01485 [Candidatus Aenigmarchaeota archaeon CG_4_10_14_0_8_um_filter_37_24]|nr:MAG: hypothetical protein COY38_01485 [Candidatus Aenigmarchaeota archaeon CG_4_10_14_0_8_um_filter_37_24]